jgi:cytosolic 5'-nucleotidase 3
MAGEYFVSPEFEKKREKIIKDGASRLHIIADFDSTLSLPATKEGQSTSSVSIIRKSIHMSQEYRNQAQELFEHYAPIEQDHTLSFEKRSVFMAEWWKKHLTIMVEYGLSRQVIKDSVTITIRALRDGFEELAAIANSKSIPFIIFSAGLGDVIYELLVQKNISRNSLQIISNRFDFDPNSGLAVRYREPIIYSMNKSEVGVRGVPEVAELLKHPVNAIVIGDSLDDYFMADGVGYEIILKVGFLNHFSEEKLEVYKKLYDIVLPHDAGLESIVELLD